MCNGKPGRDFGSNAIAGQHPIYAPWSESEALLERNEGAGLFMESFALHRSVSSIPNLSRDPQPGSQGNDKGSKTDPLDPSFNYKPSSGH